MKENKKTELIIMILSLVACALVAGTAVYVSNIRSTTGCGSFFFETIVAPCQKTYR